MLGWLLNHGGDPNAVVWNKSNPVKELLTIGRHYGSPVRFDQKELDIFLLLVKANVDVNVKDGQGRSLLHYLVSGSGRDDGRTIEAIRAVLQQGADPNTHKSLSPLHELLRFPDFTDFEVEVTKLLLGAGADPELRDEQGRTPADVVEKRRSNSFTHTVKFELLNLLGEE